MPPPRILYCLPTARTATGGAKMVFRHVETLTDLGYRAAVRLSPEGETPRWFEHRAPVVREAGPPESDAILVLPEDDAAGLVALAKTPNRKVIFCQNPYMAAAVFGHAQPSVAARYRVFMACSPGVGLWIARNFDHDAVGIVPGFADEAIFAPTAKERRIAVFPRKRPMEFRVIQTLFVRRHSGADGWQWDIIRNRTERETAAALARASVSLSLARLEGMSLTVLEAMASGCLMAGFTGIGPREYVTDANGLWADEDDCEAAADALVRVCKLAEEDGAGQHLMRHAALATARQWNRGVFASALDQFWREAMGLIPDGG